MVEAMQTRLPSPARSIAVLSLGLFACATPAQGDETESETSAETSADQDGDSGESQSSGVAAGGCDPATFVGAITLSLEDEYTGLQGQVKSAVTPSFVPVAVASEGVCTFYQPPNLFCDPPCSAGETCGAEGACIPTPTPISLGTVSIDGLGAAIDMQSSAPAYFYTYLGTLAHPPVDEGSALTMRASGSESVSPFTLGAFAITALEVDASSVTLEQDVPVAVTWTPGGEPSATILAVLDIAQHGGNPGSIRCEFPDQGALEIPVALTNQLLNQGFSGFPSLVLTRRSVDHVQTQGGCLEWLMSSTQALSVIIDGLTSCGDDEDCIAPETCQPDLSCG